MTEGSTLMTQSTSSGDCSHPCKLVDECITRALERNIVVQGAKIPSNIAS